MADVLEAGAIGNKTDVKIGRYSEDGETLMEFEDGTAFEVILRRVKCSRLHRHAIMIVVIGIYFLPTFVALNVARPPV